MRVPFGQWARYGASVIAIGVLLSCGGGGSDSAPQAQSAQAPTNQKALRVFGPTTPIPVDANLKGMWSPVTNWPLIAIHAVVLPDGRVLSYGTNGDGQQTANFTYDVWDSQGGLEGGHLTLPNSSGTDLFCSSQLVLPDGNVFIAGGDTWNGTNTTNIGNNNSNLYDYRAYSLTRANNLNRPRWYSTSTTLLNGETYIQGGAGGTDFPEVRGTQGAFRLLSGADTSSLYFAYPRNFVAPDGRVFGFDGNGNMYYVDASGAGTFTPAGQFPSTYAGFTSSAAMFSPGRILQFGGNSNGAIVIDVRGASPTYTATQSMSTQRHYVTGTLLADGKVLATGGSSTGNDLVGVNNAAEIWNPATGAWTLGSSGARARLYHSSALLMPDATVLVAGGGAPGPQTNTNVEVYYPPYLFTAAGQLATRPVIQAAPTVLDIGKVFTLQATGDKPVSRVVMVKTGSVTHGFNMEQRFVDLAFARNGGQLSVQAPARAADAPPGFYMLFALDSAGVPSEAKIVRVNVAATPNPSIVPTLVNPGNQSSSLGQALSLQLRASDPNGDQLSYLATGLPPGLSLNGSTGLISGTPNTGGSYFVGVTVSDGVNVASVTFNWTISGGSPVVSIPVPPPAVVSGSAATYTASLAGSNVWFKWNFGDGSAATPYSRSPTATHTFSRPGLYNVTVTAIDDRGVESNQTVLQAIYLPGTARQPNASTNIMLAPLPTGGTRLWVVNQDNDSVSVFEPYYGTRLAEIAVGSAPRTLALASNGLVWVTNKQAASISVIDPGSNRVIRTIPLPRGSQPFGVVMAPGGSTALVVLEAIGQMLKFDTSDFTQRGVVMVGPNPRHVSVSGDGATAHVSRFITQPLAGESTSAIDTRGGGGEVVSVNVGAMSIVRTFRLAHSDKPDAENQGRGVPNYLGAAVISPDGTQAWVPSKQDNIKRGTRRDGLALNFQSTVRAISSRLDLANNFEDRASRIDHDNASMASAAVFDSRGIYLFVALETSREVAVVDAHGRRELFRIDVGRAPQGLAVSADQRRLYVSNFMDRSVSVFDLKRLITQGQRSVPLLGTLASVGTEKLASTVLRGKQFFYDARDTRLSRDRYMSCASCHNDGGHDGRVWDLSNLGEGVRNTINLRGRAGGQGFKHWSNNFDEVQDFEGQIRALAGGTGLMSDAAFNAGTRREPLGDRKAGVSADLDALAAYVSSLATFDPSPYRPNAATLSRAAAQGKAVFINLNCATCHSGGAFTGSGANTLSNIGTLKPASGQRLNGPLAGIDIPTLRDVWATAPYLHDGSAPTLGAAVRAHKGVNISDWDLALLTAYLREIGGDEPPAVISTATGTGLAGNYFNNYTLSGSPALIRHEAVDFNWQDTRPGDGLGFDDYSIRWVGSVVAKVAGSYRFQTESDDGVRLWVNGVLLINNWTDHAPQTDTSGVIALAAGQRVSVRMEYYQRSGGAVARLRWQPPGSPTFAVVPVVNLFPQ